MITMPVTKKAFLHFKQPFSSTFNLTKINVTKTKYYNNDPTNQKQHNGKQLQSKLFLNCAKYLNNMLKINTFINGVPTTFVDTYNFNMKKPRCHSVKTTGRSLPNGPLQPRQRSRHHQTTAGKARPVEKYEKTRHGVAFSRHGAS